MNNGNETFGLRVNEFLLVDDKEEKTFVNVNLYSPIKIQFSAELNPSTIVKNILLLEDKFSIYENYDSLKDYSKFGIIKGTVSYKDRILTFMPDVGQLKPNKKYILILNNGLCDILGNRLVKKEVCTFTTSKVRTNLPIVFRSPKFGVITEQIPTFEWDAQDCAYYIFQVSMNNSFELLCYEENIPFNGYLDVTNHPVLVSHIPDMAYKEGQYYVRVKSDNGQWSDPFEFYLKDITPGLVAKEDQSELLHLDEFLENLKEPVEVLEQFPTKNQLQVGTKTDCMYLKLKGRIPYEEIDFAKATVFGESMDETGENHGEVNGTWKHIYDPEEDVTFLVFTPTLTTLVSEPTHGESYKRYGEIIIDQHMTPEEAFKLGAELFIKFEE